MWQAVWAGLADIDSSGINGPHLQGPSHDPKSGSKQDLNPGPKHMLKPSLVQASRSQVWRPIGSKPNNMGNFANNIGKTGSGVVETRLPEVTVSNRFSTFQVGEALGSCEIADLTSPPVIDPEDSDPPAGMTENTKTLSLAPAVTILHPPIDEDIARSWGSGVDGGRAVISAMGRFWE